MASSIEVLALAKLAFYDTKPTAMLWQNSSQSIASGNAFVNPVTWDQTTDDNWSGHSGVTNPSRYTVQVAGLYKVGANVSYHGSAGLLVRALALQVNGTILNGAEVFEQSYSNNFLSVTIPDVNVRCNVGDYIEANTWQNSGSALTLIAGACYMSVEFLHF